MYWRYSANSTLKPLNGLRWRPERKPSTTVRALSSIDPSRASTAGSRNRRARMLQAAPRPGHRLDQPIDQRVGCNFFRLRVEIRDDAMPQNRMSQRTDVANRYV